MLTDSNLISIIRSLIRIFPVSRQDCNAYGLAIAYARQSQNITPQSELIGRGMYGNWQKNLIKRRGLMAFVLLICSFSIFAQVNMTVQLTPPYDVPLDEIKDQITLTINGPVGTVISGELRLNFTRTTDEGVIVRTLPNQGKMISISDGTSILSGSDFDAMLSARSLEFIGVGANEALNGEGLPPGEYNLCFFLISGRLGGTIGSGCTNFTVPEPAITINTHITAPYNQPLGDLSEQVSVMLTASRGINDGLLRMTLTGDNGINITTAGRGKPLQLDKNDPLTLTGSDLDVLFASTNLNFSGITPGEANANGLPPGDYQICFRLSYNGEKSQTGRPPEGCDNFTIDRPVISITTTINPPYDKPLNELSDQVRVTVNAPIDIDDGFFTMQIQGNNGVKISTRRTAKDFLQIEKNVPFVASGSDLDFHFNEANLNFQGITPEEANENGLPPGNYEICFRLWYDDNEPATDVSDGCANFSIDRGVVSLATTVVPPYDSPFNEYGDQTTVTINSTQLIDDGFLSLRLTGNNGIQITSKSGAKDFLVIDKNTPTSLTGSDLSFLFQAGNLNYKGTSANEVNENGLPPGDYALCFRLWYADNDPATEFVCSNFRIDRGVVTLSTRIVPPYDVLLSELADQVTVSINATKNINNAFLRLLITGNNGVQISSKPGQKELFDVEGNDPLILTGSDLDFHFNVANLNFQGISAQEANANGLPPGEYELCFRLWYGDNDPATGVSPSGCATPFTIQRGTASLSNTLSPPYDQPFEDLSGQSTVIINSTQDIDDGFLTLSLTGDNGIKISTKATAKEFIQVEKNVPLTLAGGDLSFWFNPANLNYQGISASEANENGLPPGNYNLCFRLWYGDNDPATDAAAGCANFSIERGVVTLTTMVVPPYDVPFNEFGDQSTVTIYSSKLIDDGFLRLRLTGNNGIQITTKAGAKDFLVIDKNTPTSLTGSDLSFLFQAINLNYQGITATEVNDTGLPPGDYTLCFQLWYVDNEPATDFVCSNFSIGRGVITLVPLVTPPFDVPFNAFSDQTTLTLTSTQLVKNAFLRLRLTGNNGIQITSKNVNKEVFNIEKNEPLALNGSDLDFLYNAVNLNYQGITAQKANEDGLPPGDYELCFRLWYADNDPATEFQCINFSISQGVVSLTTILTPPVDQPFQDLDGQTTVMINSSQDIDDGFLTLSLEGDNGIRISSKAGARDFLQIEQNVPLSLTGSELSFLFNSVNLNFLGITANVANEDGLPPGNYELCFRLWYGDNDPATDESMGCGTFSIGQGVVTLNTIFTPPYVVPLAEMPDQTTVNINATQVINDSFLQLSITGDNGIEISSKPGKKLLMDIEKNEPLSLSGTDLDYYFNAANLNFKGTTATAVNENGLPPGNYELCFRLWYNEEEPATGEAPIGCAAPFTIGEGVVTINTVVTPPYNAPLDALLDQTSVTITSTRAMDDGFLTLDLRGDNGIHISSNAEAVKEALQIFPNEPLVIAPGDLIALNGAGTTFDGTTYTDAVEHGLPPGNYEFCFRLWHDVNEPATDENSGCAMFSIQQGVVTINTVITPPYETPFSDLADQVTVSILSTQDVENAYLTLLLEAADADFSVRSDVADVHDRYVNLETNELFTLSGTDLSYLFEPSRLFFQGIDPGEVNESGLPPGDYTLCFRLWYENGDPVTDEFAGCVNFSVAPAIVSLNTVVLPPFNQPVNELPEQINVTINTNRNLNDVFLRVHIEGDNGVQVNTRADAKDLFDIEENIPLVLTGIDLDFLFHTSNLMVQGITAAHLNDFGLPPGLYELCFQLWYNENEPATDDLQGCSQFTIEQAHLTLAVQAIPPYTPLIEDMGSMTNLTLMATADMQLALRMRVMGDNDITIANPEAFLPTELITLEANTPLLLNDLDLSEYFAANALVFSGIGQGEVFRNGLPEGNYQICFTALTPEGKPLDVLEACSNMFPVNYIEPPQVMTPECGSVISANDAQHLLFNWLPAIGALANTEYTLKMVELLNPNQNPNDAILSSTTPSFLEETVTGTSFFYGPDQPVLEPGRTYAFLVYVGEDVHRGNYINNGASPVCFFTIEDEEEESVVDEVEETTKNNVTLTSINQNPFPGYFFPVSEVSGTLKYKFKEGAFFQGTYASSNQFNASSSQNMGTTSGSNEVMTNSGNGGAKQGFAQAGSFNNNLVSNAGKQTYFMQPVYNKSDISAAGAKPLPNVKVSLLQTYVLYGQLNGETASGKLLQDGDIKQNKNGFESTAAPGWNEVVATTTTDNEGNFNFHVIQFDSLGGGVDVDWSSTSGDLYSTHMHIKGKLYKTYRLIVESPYYCSPDMNIMVQPWEGVDLGTLVSYVRSYNLRVHTKKMYNNFYDYNFGNDPVLTNVETELYREVPVGQVPVDEGQHAYQEPSSQVVLQEKMVGEGKTNAEGVIEFKNLVRHNANNTLDQYKIVCETNEYVGDYNFHRKEVPYPVFPYNQEWDWKKDEIAITFNLPTSQDYGYGVFPVYNSQFQVETFETTLEMKPELPRVAGQVLSKQAEVTPKGDPDAVGISFANASASQQSMQVQNSQLGALGSGFQLTTNSSEAAFTSSNFYLGSMGLINVENWSNKVNMAPVPNAPMRMIAAAAKDIAFNGITTVPTDANGQYKFEGLQVEFNMEALNNENALDDALWTSIVGPSRALLALVPGFKSESRDLGILKWGDQRIVNFELEPDGYVFGYVEDEWGNPVKAEVFVDSLVSTTTVVSAEYQQILGIPMPLKEVFVLKAPSGNKRKLQIVPDNLIYVPGTFEVNIEKNQDEFQPQNLGGFKVETYKHRIQLRVVEKMQFKGDIAVQPPVKNALVRVTNILNSGPDKNTKTSGETASSGGQFQLNSGNQIPQNFNNQNNQIESSDNMVSLESASNVLSTSLSEKIYGYTDANGYVELVFENNGHYFDIEILPPADKDLIEKTITLYSESSGETVDHGKVELDPAFRISGKVTYGNDSIPLENARVLIDQGGDNIECRTDAQGNYTLKGIPLGQNQWSVSAENVDYPLTLVADFKTIIQPFPQKVNFHLTVFDAFEIKELMGLPVTVTAIEEVNGVWFVTGAFINLPANPNFTPKEDETRLKFFNIPVAPTLMQGKKVAVPVEPSIATETDRLDLINYTTFIAKQTPAEGNLLKVTADALGKGFIAGKVDIMSTSFQFEENYMSFNQSNTSSGNKQGKGVSQNNSVFHDVASPTDDIILIQDAMGKAYIQLFTDNTSIRLYEVGNNEQKVTTLKAVPYPVKSFGVTNPFGGDYAFKVQDFKARARKQDSYIYRDSVVLATTLITNNIPKIVPQNLEINVGEIRVTAHGYEKILGTTPIQFKLEEWEVVCEEWELDQYSTGIKAKKGTLKTSLFHTGMKNIKITPNDFDPGTVDLNNITFGGVVPVKMETNNLAFGMNPACTSDNQPHWMLKVTGTEGNPGASIQNLPGMIAGDKINIESFTLYSNDEKELNIGDQQQSLLFYDIVHVSPTIFTVVEGGLEMTAMMDLNIPRLSKSVGGFRYVKNGNQVESVFKGMEVNFEGPGKVKFTGIDQEGAQTLTQGTFDAKGKISDPEGIFLLGRLHKDKDSTYVIVEPLHQQLPIADDGSNKLIEITGDMEVEGPDWEYFVFSGDLYGMKGVEDSQKRKTFTVYGSINAEHEGMDVKNISADFGGISMTYDIKNARLTGELDFEQDFSAVSISGHANLLADRDGWYFMANGAMEVPGFGNLKAGLGIGDYGKMAPDMKTTLLANAYDKTIPPSFQNGFSGFFFTGRKNFPQFSIPKTEFNFIIVSGALSGETGLDARLWMGFDDNGAEFGIGVMAYAYIDVALSGALTCTSVYGHVGAELGVKGMYNTGNSTFSLQGCGAIILAGKVEQCFGALGACCYECCVSTEGSTALKVDMLIDSNGTFDASLGFGSCSGNSPGMGGNW